RCCNLGRVNGLHRVGLFGQNDDDGATVAGAASLGVIRCGWARVTMRDGSQTLRRESLIDFQVMEHREGAGSTEVPVALPAAVRDWGVVGMSFNHERLVGEVLANGVGGVG